MIVGKTQQGGIFVYIRLLEIIFFEKLQQKSTPWPKPQGA